MNVAFRADASKKIGSGHVMRCLVLADALKKKGARPFFVSRTLDGNMIEYVKKLGFETRVVESKGTPVDTSTQAPRHADWLEAGWEEDAEGTAKIIDQLQADWLVVDHYALDARWEKRVGSVKRMILDDSFDRPHDADLLVDQNLGIERAAAYRRLTPKGCRLLMGPRFSLLRSEFLESGRKVEKQAGQRVVVFLGGADPTNATSKMVRAVASLQRPDLSMDVLVGMSNPHAKEIESLCASTPRTKFFRHIAEFASFLQGTDLVVGASGTSTWERCLMGLASVTVSFADHQEGIGFEAGKAGVCRHLGPVQRLSESEIGEAVKDLLDNPLAREEMGRKGKALVDGLGVKRVLEALR